MKKFWIDCVLATVFVFVVLWGLSGLTELNIFNALDPISQALEDTELTDYAFSTLRVEDPPLDTNIVIVNIGYLSRGDIGRQIQILNQFEPKVIALDILFNCQGLPRDSINCPQAFDLMGNAIFANAIHEAKAAVLGLELHQSKALIEKYGDIFMYDSIEHTDEDLRGDAHEGFVNLITNAEHQEDVKICRRFNPKIDVNGEAKLAFATQIAMLYDSTKAKRFLERENQEEIINYRGNIVDWHGASNYPGRYMVLDWDQALDTSTYLPSMIKDKIVLLGFLGADLRDTSWDDKFFTPLNSKFAGRARPDMYGIVVHANAISMILNEDYIDELPGWVKNALAIVICFLNVVLFSLIYYKLPIWFDTLSIGLQLVQLVLFAIMIPYFMYWFDFKLEITIALAALALAGPCFEIYISIIKTGFRHLRNKLFTNSQKEVLTPNS